MKNLYLENWFKNLVVILILIPAYLSIQSSLSSSLILSNQSNVGSLLVAVSILAVTACFGNFAFTYEKIEHKNFTTRLLSHLTTGLLMLLIGLSLEMTSVLATILIGDFPIFNGSLFILYFASVLYDFWDLKRAGI